MRDLFDRFGWFVQFALGVGTFVALMSYAAWPLWAAALVAVGASFVGTWLLALVVGVVFG